MFREGSGTLLILTDGGISCGALSSPMRPGFTDCNGCVNEWESPSNLVSLVTGALNAQADRHRRDPAKHFEHLLDQIRIRQVVEVE